MEDTIISEGLVPVFLGLLRFIPVFVFAQPFASIPAPATVRVALGAGLAVGAGAMTIEGTPSLNAGELLNAVFGELFLSLVLIVILNIAFGSVFFIGRVLDVQAGFGLATVLNPASREQQPLIGTILSVGAAVIFFSAGGGQAFVRLAHEVAERVPFGAYRLAFDPNLLAQFAAYCYLNAIQFGSAAILAFFVADWCLAFLSRVVPQLNVLVLSIQIKAALLLGILAATIPVLLPLVMRLSNEAIRVILSVAKT